MNNTKENNLSQGQTLFGYAGKILRVDLTTSSIRSDKIESDVLRKYMGGATLGIKYLYDEVPPGVAWSDPANRLFLGTGPLGGTRVGGSGSIAAVSKGPLTNGIGSSQANGFFGAFLRFAGYDGIILEGASSSWNYLYLHDGIAELRDASHLIGMNNIEVDAAIKKELDKKEHEISILSIGPAGENLVKFACLFVDMGHIAAHNGLGAVMGSKKLKAIAIERGKYSIPLYDREALSKAAKDILNFTLNGPYGKTVYVEGTVGMVYVGTKILKDVPVKNYTSNVNPMPEELLNAYTYQNIRTKFKAKPSPCWACQAKHCHMMEVTEGKYAGRVFEEPEYEGMAAASTAVGVEDVTMTVVLSSEIDWLGMDANEAGWVMAFAIECYEKGILTKKDTDGLELKWGNGEALMILLNKIARREGIGNLLAEGVLRASQKIGGQALEMAICTQKGNTPRGHDHRVAWTEMFDTIVSNVGTLEAHRGAPFKSLGLTPVSNPYDPEQVSTIVAKYKGAMIFEDSMCTCRINTSTAMELLCDAVNAATGWNLDVAEAMAVGRRAVNLARVFNLRHGIPAELDAPSPRYGSTLPDGPAAGIGIMPHLNQMLRNYYHHMGWDENTGKPLPETLTKLGLDFVIPQLS